MLSPTISLSLIEIAKSLIQGYFSLMEMTEKTEEEIKAIFEEELRTFKENKPEDLPDV